MIPAGQMDDTLNLLCLIKGYFPNTLSTEWSSNDGPILSEIYNFIFPLTGNPPAHSLVSQVTDNNNNNFKSKTYQCSAIFQSINITKIIPKGFDTPPDKPFIHLWQGTCSESNGELEITCQVYNLTSQRATIKWYINDQERSFPKDDRYFGKSQNHYFAMQSTIYIRHSLWNNGVRVKCHVTDPITKKTAEDTIKKCSDSFNCLGINMFMVPPSIEDLFVYNMARIQCVTYNLKDANEDYSFEWSFPGASDTLNIQTENPELHRNGTYSVTSFLNVYPDAWNQMTEFTCVFTHKGLQTPIISRIKKENVAKRSQPVVHNFPPSEEEIAQKEMCTVLCISYNFYPISIYVGWTENEMEVPKDRYVNSEPKLETNGNTYFIISKLTIPCSSWDSGNNYSCVVGHETLPLNFIRRSIDKNSGNPKVVNVLVSMSDTTLSCY